MNSGIYKLTVTRPDGSSVFYFGQSIDTHVRTLQHQADLRRGGHRNQHLQRAFDKYKNIRVDLVCMAPESQLNWIEQALLDRHWEDPDCVNLARFADCAAKGPRKIPRSKAHSEAISAWQKEKSREYKWYHPEHGARVYKQWELREEFPELTKPGLCRVAKGQRTHHKGWRVVK